MSARLYNTLMFIPVVVLRTPVLLPLLLLIKLGELSEKIYDFFDGLLPRFRSGKRKK